MSHYSRFDGFDRGGGLTGTGVASIGPDQSERRGHPIQIGRRAWPGHRANAIPGVADRRHDTRHAERYGGIGGQPLAVVPGAPRRIEISQGAKLMLIEAGDERLTDGFHGHQPDGNPCWTNGDALLPAATFAGFSGAVELGSHAVGTTHYPLFADPVERVAA